MAKQKKQADPEEWGEAIADEVLDHSLIMRSWGLDKTGKNHFGFTMPGPIYGLYLDPGGTRGVAEKFVKEGKEIRQQQFRFNKNFNDQDTAIEVRDKWIDAYYKALKLARSIQFDETEFWELARWAQFGQESALTREYGPVNGMYRNLIQDAFNANVNLHLIQKVKEIYKGDKATGEYRPDGFKQAGNIVQISLEHRWTENEGFMTKIVKCRQNIAIWGMEFTDLTFAKLGVQVYPDTEEEDWE